MTKCRHFDIEELVDPETFRRFGGSSWMFLNPAALSALDDLREFFGVPVTVNNWHKGGPFRYRGFRPRSCTVGGEYSQHRLGNAFDCDIKGVTADEARQRILANKDDVRLMHITCLEDKVNWVHFDCRNIPDRIRVVQP